MLRIKKLIKEARQAYKEMWGNPPRYKMAEKWILFICWLGIPSVIYLYKSVRYASDHESFWFLLKKQAIINISGMAFFFLFVGALWMIIKLLKSILKK